MDESGRVVEYGRQGELLLRGYHVTDGGYWGDAQSTLALVDAEGWLHTGDLAVLDTNGFARVVGRIKEIIVRGGGESLRWSVRWFLRWLCNLLAASPNTAPDVFLASRWHSNGCSEHDLRKAQ